MAARAELPLVLARIHAGTPVGTTVDVRLSVAAPDRGPLFTGAGFHIESATGTRVRATRLRTLPDLVRPGLRLLVCGLNPSLFAADAGVPFGRPGNRFWPAALAAGLVTRDRDPWHAVDHDGVGFTDLVKRATVGASELAPAEYRAGIERLEWVVQLVVPAAVCFVGLAGWRAAVDRRAGPGPQPLGLAGVPVYVMPNTSGLNAHAKPADFAAHLRAALLTGSRG